MQCSRARCSHSRGGPELLGSSGRLCDGGVLRATEARHRGSAVAFGKLPRRGRKTLTSTRTLCRSSRGKGSGGKGFAKGLLIGGLVCGVLGWAFAPDINRKLFQEDGDKTKLPRGMREQPDDASGPGGGEDEDELRATRASLSAKITELNRALDEVQRDILNGVVTAGGSEETAGASTAGTMEVREILLTPPTFPRSPPELCVRFRARLHQIRFRESQKSGCCYRRESVARIVLTRDMRVPNDRSFRYDTIHQF